MKEQPLFAPGDRVVCVDSKKANPTLIEGSQYVISTTVRMPCCGGVSVGVSSIVKTGHDHICGYCGSIVLIKPAVFRQTRFVPVDFDKYADEVLHESLKGKPVVKHELN